jgi:hypothetical protein
MRFDRFDRVDVADTNGSLPLKSNQDSASVGQTVKFGLLAMLAASIVTPLYGLAIYGLSDGAVRQQIAERPLVALQIAIALAFWAFLFGWPLKQLFSRLVARRTVQISEAGVAVADRHAFGATRWKAPLDEYLGIAHHIRSSLSGNRHEVVLVHPDRRKSVSLMIAEHISEQDLVRFAALLRMPQIPATDIARLRRRAGQRNLISDGVAAAA